MANFSLKQMTLQDYWHVFLRRKWMIFIPTGLVLALAIPGIEMITPIYQATASLIPEELKASDVLEEVSRVKSPKAERIDTAREKILSQSYLLKVAEKTELLTHLPPKIRQKLKTKHDVIIYMRRIIRFQSRGGIIYVIVQHPSPKQAMILANTIAQVYVDNTEAMRRNVTGKSYEFLDEQLKKQEEILRKTEQIYKTALEEGYIETLRSEDTGITGELKQLRLKRVDVEFNLANARNELKVAQETTGDGSSSAYVEPRVTMLEAQLAGLQTELDRLLVHFTEEWPEVVQKRDEIARVQKELMEARASSGIQMTREQRIKYWTDQVYSLSSQLTSLEDSIRNREQLLSSLPAVQLELERLKRDRDSAAETYSLLKSQRDAAMLTQAAELQQLGQVAEILDHAIEPRDPIKPNKRKYHMLALILGLMIGTGTAFLAEYFDQSIHSVADVRQHLGVPVLGTIPHARQGTRTSFEEWTPALAGMLVLGLLFGVVLMDMIMARLFARPPMMWLLATMMFQ